MKQGWLKFITCSCFLAMCSITSLIADHPPTPEELAKQTQFKEEPKTLLNDGVSPRVLHDYVEQEKEYWEFIKKVHPIFQYEKEGRLVGKYSISDRVEEFEQINKGPEYAKLHNMDYTAVTYRLGMESILDYPNKFVGHKKCGECHPAQYAQWERSRHAKTIRWPEELEEVGGDVKKGLPGAVEGTPILTTGIQPDDTYGIIGTPRTKYGYLDKWLVRGTYYVEDGNLSDMTGKIVAGGNQYSVLWAKFLTPEMTKKIAAFSPGFPTTMEEFGGSGSHLWGMNSYGATNRKAFRFQPASAYCEVCHSFKFDFKSKEEFYAALGDSKKLREHTIARGVSCEECHGAGAHLYGARGAGMPSNCERCHQRFSWHKADSEKNPRKPFNVYFKSSCPSCGTEGSQMFSSAHYDKGMRCNTCHDPHEVTANDWKDGYTLTGLKKTCQDCHEVQTSFFKFGGVHAKDNCTGCHMPNMMSCENFAAVQNPDKGGFDNVRASHIWNIMVDKDRKSANPPPGQPRKSSTKGWTLDRDENGRFFVDLMWSCGRTSFSDPNLMKPGASGCHSPVQSTLPDKLKFTDQAMIYDLVMEWQMPVKDGYSKTEIMLRKIDRGMSNNKKLTTDQKARVISYAKQAQDILDKLQKDGSWGVHGPKYSLKLVEEAMIYAEQANDILEGKTK